MDISYQTVFYHIVVFLSWTFCIYWMHRFVHEFEFLRQYHMDHHAHVTNETLSGVNWKSMLLWFDSWKSTVDQWIMEVIPTIIISLITGHWWLMVFYYVWAAFIQEAIEHNKKINLYPFITSGKWHLIHHQDATKNYGVFFPIWDIMFGTWKNINGNGK